jgi:hypothetical protein
MKSKATEAIQAASQATGDNQILLIEAPKVGMVMNQITLMAGVASLLKKKITSKASHQAHQTEAGLQDLLTGAQKEEAKIVSLIILMAVLENQKTKRNKTNKLLENLVTKAAQEVDQAIKEDLARQIGDLNKEANLIILMEEQACLRMKNKTTLEAQIGKVIEAKVIKEGLEVRAQIVVNPVQVVEVVSQTILMDVLESLRMRSKKIKEVLVTVAALENLATKAIKVVQEDLTIKENQVEVELQEKEREILKADLSVKMTKMIITNNKIKIIKEDQEDLVTKVEVVEVRLHKRGRETLKEDL